MSVVERENAVVGKQIRMRVGFRYDRTGNLFDPPTFTQVQVFDSDHSTVLETIAPASIVKYGTGKYYFESSLSWNTKKRKTFDRWEIIYKGKTYYLEESTLILDTAIPSVGIASFVSLVKLKVQAPTIGPVSDKLTDPDDYESLIGEAVKEYSRRKPQKKVAKLTGDGNSFFSLPSDWEVEFSRIREIEYPLDSNNLSCVPPYMIDPKYYEVADIDTGWICRFRDTDYPGLNEQFYFRYTIRHSVDDSSSTIPVVDKEGLCNLAASLCCMALASAYGHTAESSIDADVVAYRTRGDEFSSRAKELFNKFDKEIRPEVTGMRGEWDIKTSLEGYNDLLLRRSVYW